MKRLLYLLLFTSICTLFSSCSNEDELEEIQIEAPQYELDSKEEEKTVSANSTTQPARDPIPSKSPF